jgi:gentisate 1,2-dioxygenase
VSSQFVTHGVDDVRQAWKEANLRPLWESATAHKPGGAPEGARKWEWKMVRPLVAEAIHVVSPADVERRALNLLNPREGAPEVTTTTRTLNAAYQVLLPGECARAHRHTINAIRFVLEGTGAITVVNGKDCSMNEGDLILTPGWTWHEHIHHGSSPIIWLDVLDGPLQRFLGVVVFENGPANDMPAVVPDRAFASASILPEVDHAQEHSPVFSYPYEAAAAAVANAPPARDGARRVRYVNPITGGPAITILDSHLVQLDSGCKTTPFLTTSNALCTVVEGTGETQVGDTTVSWGPKDVFTLPQNNWVSHRASGATARLFVVSDREVLARLGLLKEQYADDRNGA